VSISPIVTLVGSLKMTSCTACHLTSCDRGHQEQGDSPSFLLAGDRTLTKEIPSPQLSEQRIIIYGSGSAGLGIARQLRDAMVVTDGISQEEASSKFYLLDVHGLIKNSLGDKIRDGFDKLFIRKDDENGGWGKGETGLADVVQKVKPTVMIGTSTHAGAFTVGRQRQVDRMLLTYAFERADDGTTHRRTSSRRWQSTWIVLSSSR
jgi:hypothetical protein